ncbi:HEAT repeat domain-containing protein [Streptomyces filamentosus]|uniref:HEAT repeat domain-containing protein n=1 Tax=Streptomyces filamentosus TaxID=67294 RepID=UPI003F4CDC04
MRSFLQGADSPSWAVRAAAGRGLAGFAGVPEADGVLRRLLVDGGDTFVTQETAEALLERRDARGLRLVLGAFAGADDDTADQLSDALFGVCCRTREDAERFAALCAVLAEDPDGAVRGEARWFLGRLG